MPLDLYLLLFILLFTALLMALPYWRYRYLISKSYKAGLMQHFRLKQSSKRMLEGRYEDYVLAIVFIVPNYVFERIRIRLILEYKPEPGIALHEKRIKALRQHSPYQWTANLISKDIRFVFTRPAMADLETCFRDMAEVLKKEGFEGISKSDSDAYGAAWDSGCYGG